METRPVEKYTLAEEAVCPPKRKRAGYWKRMGGGSLMLSIVIHCWIAVFAVLWLIRSSLLTPQDEPQAFVSGGGGGQEGSAPVNMRRAQRPSQSMLPVMRVRSTAPGEVALQDVSSTMNVNLLAVTGQMGALSSGSGSGAGGGIGSGIGKGLGPGFGPGSAPGFVAMFGKTLQAKRLAVVLDVSASMHPYLETVVKEANKVSGGCPILLFYGCGLKESGDRDLERQKLEPARGREFKEFWQRTFSPGGYAPRNGSIPNEELFKVFDGRKDTWYFEKIDIERAWAALASLKIKDADAVYWFADFQDPVSEARLLKMQKVLKDRKQRLYVHASGDSNPSLEAVNTMLVKPTGGEILTVKIETTNVK